MANDKLIFLGGIGNQLWLNNGKRYSRNFKQGYRVYNPEGVACAITNQGSGLGGQSGLYLVKQEVNDMKLIGVTGGVGAGKSTVLKYIKLYYNCEIFVTDMIAYDIMRNNKECFTAIKDTFKDCDIFNNEGTLDSFKIGKIIFTDEEKRKKMNAIVHPRVIQYVKDEFQKIKEEGKLDFAVVESALLIESGLINICDEAWYIYADTDTRIERLKTSRGYTTKKCRDIINQQLSDEEYRNHCDICVNTSLSYDNTYKQIDVYLQDYKKKELSGDDVLDSIAGNLT